MSQTPTTSMLQATDIDGLRTFFVETGRAPSAQLRFRVGYADESLVRHGWTHLIEHLAMHDVADPRFHNGSVGRTCTEFSVEAEQDAVLVFLERLCGWLASPDLSPIRHERRILAAEERRRSASDADLHLDLRYGPHGPGLRSYQELGVEHVTADQLTQWVARHFTRDNATLALNFAPPAGLSLPLPVGEPVPAPITQPLTIDLPAHSLGSSTLVAMSFIVDDQDAPDDNHGLITNVACSVLEEAARQFLRHELAISYDAGVSVENIDARTQMLILTADIDPAAAVDGVRHVHEVLASLARDGVDPSFVRGTCDQMLRGLLDAPPNWQADVSAAAAMHDRAPLTLDRAVEEVASVTAEKVQDLFRRALDTVLITSSAGIFSVTDLPYISGRPDLLPLTNARRYFPTAAPANKAQLWLSPQVAEMREDELRLQVGLADAAAVLAYPDGGRVIVSNAGFQMVLEPAHWWRGRQLVAQVDKHVPASVVVPRGRPDEDIPATMTLRRWVDLNRKLAVAVALFILLTVLAIALP